MPEDKQQRRGGRPAALPIDKLIAILATMDDETLAGAESVVRAFAAGRGVKRNGKPQQEMLELGDSAAGGEQ